MYPNTTDLLDLVKSRQREYLDEAQNARLVREVLTGRPQGSSRSVQILARLGRQLANLGEHLEKRYGVVQSPYAAAEQGKCKE